MNTVKILALVFALFVALPPALADVPDYPSDEDDGPTFCETYEPDCDRVP